MTEGSTYETVKFDGEIANAFGRKLEKTIKYETTFEKLLTFDAIPDDEQLSQKDILAAVNEARKANARQKAMAKALDDAGVKKPVVDASPDGLVEAARQMVKMLVLTGKDEATATQIANATLGTSL